MASQDPLDWLPAEIIIRIIDFSFLSTVTRLAQLSKSWQYFIDVSQADRIYSHQSKFKRSPGGQDFGLINIDEYFTRDYFRDLRGWKDICKREVLLHKNWTALVPETRESIFHIPQLDIDQFLPDLKRRFLLTMTENGFINVICMDTGDLLWSHRGEWDSLLEYDADTGIACWGPTDNVEFWQLVPGQRGHFHRMTTWGLDRIASRVSLRGSILCACCDRNEGEVYDLSTNPPTKIARMPVEEEHTATYVYQSDDVVFFPFSPPSGYQVFNKITGERLRNIEPARCVNVHHIVDPRSDDPHPSLLTLFDPTRDARPQRPSKNRIRSLPIEPGAVLGNPQSDHWRYMAIEGNFMAAVSLTNHLFISHDWPRLLTGNQEDYDATCVLIEYPRTSHFNYEVSVFDRRVALVVDEYIYILSFLGMEAGCPTTVWQITPTAPHWRNPLFECLSIHADSLMHVYTTKREPQGPDSPAYRQVIQVLTFAPDLEG